MLSNAQITTATCGNNVLVEEFTKEQSATDAIVKDYFRKANESYDATH